MSTIAETTFNIHLQQNLFNCLGGEGGGGKRAVKPILVCKRPELKAHSDLLLVTRFKAKVRWDVRCAVLFNLDRFPHLTEASL